MYKNERNYEIDVIETAVRQVWSDMKSKSTSSKSTKRIIAQVFGVYLNEVLHMLPSKDATAQQIRYKRRKTSEHLPEPSNIDMILTFSVKCNLEVLATCGSWYIDGTFKIIPELFYQLMTVHGYFHPLVFIMWP